MIHTMILKFSFEYDPKVFGNDQSNSFADMRNTGPWCDAVSDMDYGNDHTLDESEQEYLETNISVLGTDPNLLNFSANVIHDMQVLGLSLLRPNKLWIF